MTYYILFLLFFIVAVITFVIYAGYWLSRQRMRIQVSRKQKYVEVMAFPQYNQFPEFLMEDPTEYVEMRVTEAKYHVETIRSQSVVFRHWMDRNDKQMMEHMKRRAAEEQKHSIFKAMEPFFETKVIEEFGPYGEPVQETQIMVLKRIN